MPTAEINTELNVITLETQWNEKDLIASIPGSSWNNKLDMWTVPLTWAACIQLRGIFRDHLVSGPLLAAWSWNEYQTRIQPAMELRQKYETGDPEYGVGVFGRQLYEFQHLGVEFLTTAGSALLGDEPGCGKTITVLSAMDKLGADVSLPAIIICPNSIKRNWAQEAERWFPEAVPYIIGGSALHRKRALDDAVRNVHALVIVNYETAWRLSKLAGFGSMHLRKCRECDPRHGLPDITPAKCETHPKELNNFRFRTVVVDEAHRIKDPKAKQTRAVWAIGASAHAERRWALTGTPLANDPSDLWSLMHFVSPSEYSVKTKFVERYCLMGYSPHGGNDVIGINPDTREEFFKILDPRFRRMPKALVLSQLPPKVRQTRLIEMTPKQRKAYEDLESKLATRLDDGTVLVAANNLAAQIRLLQLSSSYGTVTVIPPLDPGEDPTYKVTLCEPSPKVDELMSILEEFDPKPIVVAAESKQLINLAAARLKKHGITYGLITGDQNAWERDEALKAFQAGKLRVMLFTVKAGGVGLTMTAADTIVFLQRSWSMVENTQAEDRVHRIGSEVHDSVMIIDLMTEGTIEERQIAALGEKMRRLDEITRDRAALIAAGKDPSVLDREMTTIMATSLTDPAERKKNDTDQSESI